MVHQGETPSVDSLEDGQLEEIPLGQADNEQIVSLARGKATSFNPLGKIAFDRKGFEAFQRKPMESKREVLKQQWLSIAHMVLSQATALCMSLPKKDYGKLVQLLTSAGISYDKVFPKVDSVQGNNLVLNLFNGLPKDRVVRVIGEVAQPSDVPLDSNTLPTPTQGELPK